MSKRGRYSTLISTSAFAIALAGIASFAFAVTPPQTKAGQPLSGLTANQAFQFQEGREYYSTPLTVAKGLGPAFNQPSCVSCHETPVGGWGATSVTHFGNLVGGNFNFLAALVIANWHTIFFKYMIKINTVAVLGRGNSSIYNI